MPQGNYLDRIRRSMATAVTTQREAAQPRRRTLAIILSIVIAFLLWLTFSLREQYTVVMEMPIEIGRLPEGRALTELPPRQVRVTVQGVGTDLMRLRRSPPSLVIHAVQDQVDVLAAATENPRLPTGVSVQSASPSTLHLSLEPEVTRRVPIELVNRVRPASDHDFLGPARLTPDSVWVTGARPLVHPMTSFPTEALEISGARETVTARVALSDTLRGLIRTDIGAVDVRLPIAAFTEGRRTLEVHVQDTPPGAPQLSIRPERVTATYRVPLDQYTRAQRSPDFFAIVSYEAAMEDETGTLQPVVQVPANLIIRDVRLEPRRVGYWIIQ